MCRFNRHQFIGRFIIRWHWRWVRDAPIPFYRFENNINMNKFLFLYISLRFHIRVPLPVRGWFRAHSILLKWSGLKFEKNFFCPLIFFILSFTWRNCRLCVVYISLDPFVRAHNVDRCRVFLFSFFVIYLLLMWNIVIGFLLVLSHHCVAWVWSSIQFNFSRVSNKKYNHIDVCSKRSIIMMSVGRKSFADDWSSFVFCVARIRAHFVYLLHYSWFQLQYQQNNDTFVVAVV